MKINLPSAVTSRVAHQTLKLRNSSPKVLFGVGLALMAGTVISASRGTLKLEAVLDDIREDRLDVQRLALKDPLKYSERETAKLNFMVTAKGVTRIAGLYLPALTMGVAAVACLTSSHNQLTRRNAGLSAALAATERAMESYRERIREAYGEDRERELWRGEKIETVPVLDDEGRETKSTKKVKVGGGYSPYSRLWGRDTSNEWDPRPEYNLAKLRSVQTWGTMELNSKGHLFLNEIFDELGLDRTPAGSQVGWLDPKYGGADGYVDFGVLARGEEVAFLDFIRGHEDHIMLDFNVDGEIWRNI